MWFTTVQVQCFNIRFVDLHYPLLIYSQPFCCVAMETIELKRLCREPSSADRCRHRGHSLIVPRQMCSCPSWPRSSAVALPTPRLPPNNLQRSSLLNAAPLKPTGDFRGLFPGSCNNWKNKIRISMRRHARRCARPQMHTRPTPAPFWGAGVGLVCI